MWSALLILVPLYLVAAGLLFANRVREFADETDNLLGGLLISHGYRLYVDYFSSHMPLAYYVAAAGALLGATSLEQFRVFSSLLLLAATLGVTWGFGRGRRALPIDVLGVWATLTVLAHRLQWGEMLTASTCAGYGVLVAGLLFYSTPGLRFSWLQMVALSSAVFVAVQSELVAVFPLVLLGACFVAVRLAAVRQTSLAVQARAIAVLGLLVVAPHALVLLGFWWVGALGELVYDAYQFNHTYYSQYLMNPSVIGVLHDWEAQYRTYLLQSLQEPLGVQGCLVLANVFATGLIFRSRGPVVAALYYLFVGLTHVRNEGAYYLCSYFSLALIVVWATGTLRAGWKRWQAAPAALVVLVAAAFVGQVGAMYDLSRQAPRVAPEVGLVQALTVPGERIFVAPYDPYVYLAANRYPASVFPFYFPWQAIDPRSDSRVFDDLRAARPPLVIFHGDELVNGQWRTMDYARRLYDFLVGQGYTPLDAASPDLKDVLVREDRIAGARERLQRMGLARS